MKSKMNNYGLAWRLVELKREYDEKVDKVKQEYALQNNEVNFGDIVRGNGVSILVDDMRYDDKANYGFLPGYIYHGVKVAKNGRPYKRGDRDMIYQGEMYSIDRENSAK
jgi:hypothetical protein